jgi:Ca2+-binding RTX toxin-like protein
MALSLENIVTGVWTDPGLRSQTNVSQIYEGVVAARQLNTLLLKIIGATKVNDDGLLSAADIETISTATYANPADYVKFMEAHGDDEGDISTGFHNVQNDGGTFLFRGRAFIDTVADAIYHFGFKVVNGIILHEDGTANQPVHDIADWLNFFLNGVSTVTGTEIGEDLGSGTYSEAFAAARNETFFAGAGNDRIWADIGNDKVWGGTGNDVAGGGEGNDRLYGEAGDDDMWGDAGLDALFGGIGNDDLGGGAGNDTLDGGTGNDTLYGQDGDDLVKGGDGVDKVHGEAGTDRLEGGAGDDELGGGDGNDYMYGEAGNDSLHGGNGIDRMRGGAGADDYFLWESVKTVDVITLAAGDSGRTLATIDCVEGFDSGQDKIDLRGLKPMTLEELDYVGGGKASCYYDGHYLRIDSNGDAASDMIIEFKWTQSLASTDFLFATV